MAGKFYAVRVGRKPGIYTCPWKEVEPLVKGYPGAAFKGFNTREEAEAFMNAASAPVKKAASASAKDIDVNIVSPQQALENLKAVKVDGVNKGEKYGIQSEAVVGRWKETCQLVDALFENAYINRIDSADFSDRSDVKRLSNKYNITLEDISLFEGFDSEFDAIAFVDGGGNKGAGDEIIDLGIEGEDLKYASSRIVFGVVFCNIKSKEISLYRYVMKRSMEYKNFFKQSNVAGEELAALLAMYISKKEGIGRLAIYQDNNLPAKYYSGKFKAIHNWDDAPAQIFINESIACLEKGLAINFLYVPSEHECEKNKKKLEKGREMYEAQNIKKLSFEQAEFFNGISDRLADYNIE